MFGRYPWRGGRRRRGPPGLALAGVLAGVLAGPLAAPARAEVVDLELVLAVDCSSSVSPTEFALQMNGLANAFRHPNVVGAILAAAPRGVAVSVVQWAGARQQVRVVDWLVVRDPASAAELAARIATAPRGVEGGATAPGSAVAYAMAMIEGNGFESERRVIDVSGDGRANEGEEPAFVRERAIAAGMTINGLAILNEEPQLDRYYRVVLVGGEGAFMLTADNFQDFARAITEKLIMEISGQPTSGLFPGPSIAGRGGLFPGAPPLGGSFSPPGRQPAPGGIPARGHSPPRSDRGHG